MLKASILIRRFTKFMPKLKSQMNKGIILVGLISGIIFGMSQSFKIGIAEGLIDGIMFGVLIGGLLYLFINSRWLKKQTSLNNADLLPGENIILSKFASFVVRPKDFGLDNHAFDDLMWTVGMKNKEVIGGALHITNYRIIFKSHKLNRIRGKTSIFLPSIVSLDNSSFFFVRRLTVATVTSKFDLIIFDVDKVIEIIFSEKNKISSKMIVLLKENIANHPSKFGDGLETWGAMNTISNLLKVGNKTSDSIKLVTKPIGALSSIFMKEIIDKNISVKWEKYLNK